MSSFLPDLSSTHRADNGAANERATSTSQTDCDSCVMKLNNAIQASGRSLDALAWGERLAGGTWHAEVTIRNVGSFSGTGATRRAAREVAAHAAHIRVTQQSESGSQ